jgi:legumain
MEDSDKEDIERETLQQQFKLVKKITNTSHVQEYGDLKMGSLVVGEFQGEQPAPSKVMPKVPYKRGAPSWEVPLDILYRRLARAQTEEDREGLQQEIDQMLSKREHLEAVFKIRHTRGLFERSRERARRSQTQEADSVVVPSQIGQGV